MPPDPFPRISIDALALLLDHLFRDIGNVKSAGVFDGLRVDIHHFLQVNIVIAHAFVPSGKSGLDLVVPFAVVDQLVFNHFLEHFADETFPGDGPVNIKKSCDSFHDESSFPSFA